MENVTSNMNSDSKMNSDTYDGKHFFKIDVLKEYNYIQDDLLVILYLCLMLYSK